jgi:hypothetical protein
MPDIIRDAINHSNDPDHGGAGYHLNVVFSTGRSQTYKVRHKAGPPGYLLVNAETDAPEFVNPAHVARVGINWG